MESTASEARGVVQEGSLIDLLGLETMLGGGDERVQAVETTDQEEMAVQTPASSASEVVVEGSVQPPNTGGVWDGATSAGESSDLAEKVSATVSPTLSAEGLLEESSQVEEPIVLSTGSRAETDTISVTSLSSASSSLAPVVSGSSTSQMASSTATPSLPRHHMTTTQAQELIITTTELDDEELNSWAEVTHTNIHLTDYDFRAKYPVTDYSIEATKPIVKMERTEPSYDRENPNRVGLADGEIDPELDHFLSHEAPLNSGGPLNTKGRSKGDNKVDRMDMVDRMVKVDNSDLKKSDRRADPGPDINDILSGLLNVVGEGLHIATNYIQENNKKKLQEKLDAVKEGEQSKNVFPEKGVNSTRVNNRGPPLGDLADQTFEAIPLLPPAGVKPGSRPVAIPQRPFRLPGPLRRPGILGNPPKTSATRQPPPFQSGVPLPALLVPGKGATPGLPSQLPTRVGYTPNFTDPTSEEEEELENEERDANKKQPLENEVENNEEDLAVKIKVNTNITPTTSLPPIKQTSIANPSTAGPSLPTESTTSDTDLQASFNPPILVTRPTKRPLVRRPTKRPLVSRPTKRPLVSRPTKRPLSRRPAVRPPWVAGQRPPRPPGAPNRPLLGPQTSKPTPPLRPTNRPLVFPTQRYSGFGGEPVVVTGVAIPAQNDVIDLTVTAQQGFGGRRPPKKKYSGKIFHRCIMEIFTFLGAVI